MKSGKQRRPTMPTPIKGYRNKAGEKIPGTTTVIGRFKESGALIAWAYNRGKDGYELYESRDKAAELGTIVHSMVESFINDGDEMALTQYLSDKERTQVMSAFEAFKEWFESNNFEIVAQEIKLESEQWQFGGTPDAIAWDSKHRLVLLDWKTSNGVYQDFLYQLGFYRILWNENHPENPLTGGSHLCRFAKENGDFVHHYYPNLDEAERAAILMVELYNIDKGLKKRC
jgi:hypothetical protein